MKPSLYYHTFPELFPGEKGHQFFEQSSSTKPQVQRNVPTLRAKGSTYSSLYKDVSGVDQSFPGYTRAALTPQRRTHSSPKRQARASPAPPTRARGGPAGQLPAQADPEATAAASSTFTYSYLSARPATGQPSCCPLTHTNNRRRRRRRGPLRRRVPAGQRLPPPPRAAAERQAGLLRRPQERGGRRDRGPRGAAPPERAGGERRRRRRGDELGRATAPAPHPAPPETAEERADLPGRRGRGGACGVTRGGGAPRGAELRRGQLIAAAAAGEKAHARQLQAGGGGVAT